MRDNLRRAIAFARDTMRLPVKAERDLHPQDLAFFLRFARPIWRVGVLALVAMTLVSAAKTVLPLSIKFFIDNVLMGGTPDPGGILAEAGGLLSSLNVLIAALLVLGIFAGGMDLIRNYWMARFREDYAFNLQTALFEHVLGFPLSYFKSQQTGYILSRLSAGQQQRIAIARAFLKDAPILILDEPTSALDMQTEDRILQTLRILTRGRTTILISHRPSLLELADRVLSIEEGRVQEFQGGMITIEAGADCGHHHPGRSAVP